MCVLLRFWLKWEFSPNTRISQRFLAQKAKFSVLRKQPKYISTSIAMWPLSKWKKKNLLPLELFIDRKQVILRFYAKSKMTYGTSPAHEATRTAGQEILSYQWWTSDFLGENKGLRIWIRTAFLLHYGSSWKIFSHLPKTDLKRVYVRKSSKMLLLMF